MIGYVEGQYRLPAIQTMAPPPGGRLWCVTCTKADARLLLTALRAKPCEVRGGVQVWEGEPNVLFVLDEPPAGRESIKATCQAYGRLTEWSADLDITGTWYGLEKAWEVL